MGREYFGLPMLRFFLVVLCIFGTLAIEPTMPADPIPPADEDYSFFPVLAGISKTHLDFDFGSIPNGVSFQLHCRDTSVDCKVSGSKVSCTVDFNAGVSPVTLDAGSGIQWYFPAHKLPLASTAVPPQGEPHTFSVCAPRMNWTSVQMHEMLHCDLSMGFEAFATPELAMIEENYPKGIPRAVIEEAYQDLSGQAAPGFHIQIIDNEVYIRIPTRGSRRPSDPHAGRVLGNMMAMFAQFLSYVKLPDSEFIFVPWPSARCKDFKGFKGKYLPEFFYADCIGQHRKNMLHFVRPYFNEVFGDFPSLQPGLRAGTYDIIQMPIKPWKSRKAKGFFRGTCTHKDRVDTVKHARQASQAVRELLDVGITRYLSPICSSRDFPLGSRVPELHYLGFKYQVALMGRSFADRMPRLLGLGSTVIAVGDVMDPHYGEWWYPYFEPNKHYVQVDSPTHDGGKSLDAALLKLKSDDDWAHELAVNARKQAQRVVTIANSHCYTAQLLTDYAKVLKDPVVRHPQAVHVPLFSPLCHSSESCYEGWCINPSDARGSPKHEGIIPIRV